MTFCVNGAWVDVVVDDYLPVLAGTRQLAFAYSQPQDGKAVLWASLLEKAWAKLNGGYDRIGQGEVDLGFTHLCGVPSAGYVHAEQ